MTEPVLVVAATRSEAAAVPTGVTLVITGIGKTPAAVATARALAELPDPAAALVLNIGTAGALRPGLAGLHLPGTVVNHDLSADLIRALGHDPQDRIDLPDGDDTVLATGDVFVTDAGVRDLLSERAHLVDMEGYAVAFAARAFGARVRLVKHVSDQADESAMEWNEVVHHSAVELGQWVERFLDERPRP